MKPFSAIYFVRENKTRCVLLMFMLFLGFAAYLGGIYVTNPRDNWDIPISYYDKFVQVNSITGDVEDFLLFLQEVEESGRARVVPTGSYNAFNWKTIMGFESGQASLTFCSVEDFQVYCEYMGIACNFDNLKTGSMIMSDRFAKNAGLALGDSVDKDYNENIFREFTLDAITDEKGYFLYFITDEEDVTLNALLLGKDGAQGGELYVLADRLKEGHDIYIHNGLAQNIDDQFETFNMIYMFIIVLVAVIMAVTVNAAFVGMYQRRNLEFAVYRAIGIPGKQIVGKIVKELLCMDAFVLVVGGAVFFLGLYLFNNLVLYPVGKYLRYFHPAAVFGFVLCNLAVLLPLMVTRSRQMLRADICEY